MNISDKSKQIMANCRFCWMCRHVCPIGNATGLERNTARARALGASLVASGTIGMEEVAENIYECALCGACTNNCVTGWDPKVFIQEVKTQIALSGLIPPHVYKLLENYQKYANVYGKTVCDCLKDYFNEQSDTLLFVGQETLINAPDCVKDVMTLMEKAGVKVSVGKDQDSGSSLWFLTGKTAETQTVAKACAENLNKYKKVIVYDPVDLKLFLHEYKEWGVEIVAEVVSFNQFVLQLIEEGKLSVKNNGVEYSLQDNYAYARELDDTTTGRRLIEKVGVNKEMLLIGKETNLAGQLIMAEYMLEVIKQVAVDRWNNAVNMQCKTVVTENPAEYVCLKATAPEGYRVITIEQMILENM